VAVVVLILVFVSCRGGPEVEADLRFQLRGDDDDILTGHLHLSCGLDKVEVIRDRFRDHCIEMRIVEGL
jgi:hypothetical protein